MANKRQLVKRRKSVKNIRKITHTMQLIATSRFQSMFKRATATKPYSKKLAQLVGDLCDIDVELEESLFEPHCDDKRDTTIVITSKRGLCGGYNAHILKTAILHVDAAVDLQTPCDVQMVGNKGINYFKFLKRPIQKEITHLADTPQFDQIKEMADQLIDQFKKGEITSLHVAYMRFYSAGRQQPEVIQLLPLTPPEADNKDDVEETKKAEAKVSVQYEFSPEPKELLNQLLPAAVRMRLFQCFTDAAVSEQIARMVAMKAATDAAGDMIKHLTRQYNRARQSHITMELLDIMGGAAAIE